MEASFFTIAQRLEMQRAEEEAKNIERIEQLNKVCVGVGAMLHLEALNTK